MRFEDKNKNLFIPLASILNTKGADIAMERDNVPYVGRGSYNGDEGFYFKANRDFFGINSKQLESSFPISIDGYKFEFASFFEFEVDDDRTWSESIGFIVSKNGKNVLK